MTLTQDEEPQTTADLSKLESMEDPEPSVDIIEPQTENNDGLISQFSSRTSEATSADENNNTGNVFSNKPE